MSIIRLTEKQYQKLKQDERLTGQRLVFCRRCGIPKKSGKCENCEIDRILRTRSRTNGR